MHLLKGTIFRAFGSSNVVRSRRTTIYLPWVILTVNLESWHTNKALTVSPNGAQKYYLRYRIKQRFFNIRPVCQKHYFQHRRYAVIVMGGVVSQARGLMLPFSEPSFAVYLLKNKSSFNDRASVFSLLRIHCDMNCYVEGRICRWFKKSHNNRLMVPLKAWRTSFTWTNKHPLRFQFLYTCFLRRHEA